MNVYVNAVTLIPGKAVFAGWKNDMYVVATNKGMFISATEGKEKTADWEQLVGQKVDVEITVCTRNMAYNWINVK